MEHGARLSVLVIDCSEAICSGLSLADLSLPLTPEPFQPDDPSLVPYIPSLLPQVGQWLRGVDRGEFFSLDGGGRWGQGKGHGKAKG